MKTKYSYFVFILVCLNIYVPYASSWDNGYYYYPFAYNESDYKYGEHYGTMDWIADGASELLRNKTYRWQFLWNMKEIYFLGTEAVDNPDVYTYLDDVVVEGIGDYIDLVVQWGDGGIHSLFYENIVESVENISVLTINAFQNEQYQLASYYCGVISAYISYIIYYPIHEIGDMDFWDDRNHLDELLASHTDDFRNPNKFFLWSDHTPSNDFEIDDLRDLCYEYAWNDSINLFWYSENLANVELVKDYDELISNYEEDSITRKFYNHYEYILNLCIYYVSDVLNTIFEESGAEGGDVEIPSMFGSLSKEWFWGVISISLGFFLIVIISLRIKGKGKKIQWKFWRKYKVKNS